MHDIILVDQLQQGINTLSSEINLCRQCIAKRLTEYLLLAENVSESITQGRQNKFHIMLYLNLFGIRDRSLFTGNMGLQKSTGLWKFSTSIVRGLKKYADF